jgi:hypothetical protein
VILEDRSSKIGEQQKTVEVGRRKILVQPAATATATATTATTAATATATTAATATATTATTAALLAGGTQPFGNAEAKCTSNSSYSLHA